MPTTLPAIRATRSASVVTVPGTVSLRASAPPAASATPIFAASTGSTHGYDITDPTRVDPALGGREGFERLARAAIGRGLGIILDIVPNHTAFTLENPWLLDVLRHGPDSRYARHFDIDWQAGPLVLPWLPAPFEQMLTEGAFRVRDGQWMFGDLALPLADSVKARPDLAFFWNLLPVISGVASPATLMPRPPLSRKALSAMRGAAVPCTSRPCSLLRSNEQPVSSPPEESKKMAPAILLSLRPV